MIPCDSIISRIFPFNRLILPRITDLPALLNSSFDHRFPYKEYENETHLTLFETHGVEILRAIATY